MPRMEPPCMSCGHPRYETAPEKCLDKKSHYGEEKPEEKYPNRPQTMEFDLLSILAHKQDDAGTPNAFLTDTEIEAVDYMGTNRAGMAVGTLTGCGSIAELKLKIVLGQVNISDLFRVVYIDAFILGKQYGEEKS